MITVAQFHRLVSTLSKLTLELALEVVRALLYRHRWQTRQAELVQNWGRIGALLQKFTNSVQGNVV